MDVVSSGACKKPLILSVFSLTERTRTICRVLPQYVDLVSCVSGNRLLDSGFAFHLYGNTAKIQYFEILLLIFTIQNNLEVIDFGLNSKKNLHNDKFIPDNYIEKQDKHRQAFINILRGKKENMQAFCFELHIN